LKKDPYIVAKIRDLVDKYDELINKMKILKEKIRESPEIFDELSSILLKIHRETQRIVNICRDKNTELDEEYLIFLQTYCDYLVLISIPYVIELLNNMKNNVKESNDRDIEKMIRLFNELIA